MKLVRLRPPTQDSRGQTRRARTTPRRPQHRASLLLEIDVLAKAGVQALLELGETAPDRRQLHLDRPDLLLLGLLVRLEALLRLLLANLKVALARLVPES